MPLTRTARLLGLSTALVVATAGIAAADVDSADQLPDDATAADRYAGENRYATAYRTALASYPDGAPTAIIARGDEFPDGLAASFLAGVENAPILLTKTDELPLETQDAMADGALNTQRAVIVGGRGAINQAVEDRLKVILGDENVERVFGQDRFETAFFVANEAEPGTLDDVEGDRGQLTTAIVASGRNFPDALAAGPLAHAAGVPILLTEEDSLPEITRIAIESRIQQVLVAGGPVAVSNDVVDEIRGLDGVEVVQRVAGGDRTATAAAFAELTREQLGWAPDGAALSLGIDFPDALSLAPAASRLEVPILLTRSTSEVGAATFAALQSDCDTLTTLAIAGGPVAIDDQAELQAELATSCAEHQFLLDADQVAGGGDTAAAGTGWIWPGDQHICYAVRVQGLSSPATGAELRVEAGGADELVASLGAPSPATGDGLTVGCLSDDEVEGDAAAYQEYRAALQSAPQTFYVVVDSEDHRDGAIRGQVAQPDPDV